MTSTLPVAGRTVIYPSGIQSALTLKNVGTETIYLDSQSNVNATGWPLGIGSSMSWDANRPLFAYAVSNGTLLLSENSGNLFDAQAVAQSILDGGLAGAIASNIAISGAPPLPNIGELDNYYGRADLLQYFKTFPNLRYSQLILTLISWESLTDVDNYDILLIRFVETDTYMSYPIPRTAWNGGKTIIKLPILSPTVELTYTTVSTQPVSIKVAGSYSTEPFSIIYNAYTNSPVGNTYIEGITAKTILLKMDTQNTTARRIKIPSRNGRCQFSIYGLGSAGNTFQFMAHNGSTAIYTYSNAAVPINGITAEMIVGDLPLNLGYKLASGTTGFSLAMTYL